MASKELLVEVRYLESKRGARISIPKRFRHHFQPGRWYWLTLGKNSVQISQKNK